MTKVKKLTPDYLFEVSWEVCNKVGGIHTVVATKAKTITKRLGDNYIAIGPDLTRETPNAEFEEDANLLKAWRQLLYNDGLRVKIGRWKIKGSPIVVLVDFSSTMSSKDTILGHMWESYKVDSISGQWDYIEPVLFGYASAKVIMSYVDNFCSFDHKVVAHFHEWMTASGGLYLKKYAPSISTVFTTHATALGRSLAGNGYPLYDDSVNYNPEEMAKQFGVVSKHSLEKVSAHQMDCFATVSDITAQECKKLLDKQVDVVTPNGFETNFVWPEPELTDKRNASRALLIKVAEACLGMKFEGDPLIVGTSGRYEFKNKGIDVFLNALKKVATENPKKEILAYITVPAGNGGPRKDLAAHLADDSNPIDQNQYKHTTHYLSEPQWDPVVNNMKDSILLDTSARVKVIFVPSYLNGDDGIFDKTYYELLAGMDVTVFASYYEPWGYTPLESVAFSVPTITTTLAGFGLWVEQHNAKHDGVNVIRRTDMNDAEVVDAIAASLVGFAKMTDAAYKKYRASALEISKTALWENLIDYYETAYEIALGKALDRTNSAFYNGGGMNHEQINFVRQQLVSNKPSWSRLMIEAKMPERLRPLEILSNNIWWSWTLGAHEVYEYIDEDLWAASEKNPIAFLDMLGIERIKEMENDVVFLDKMDTVYSQFLEYMAEKKDAKAPTIAYFSMEYGLHSSLKIYSGGLGILAGDYLKEASDKNVPMVAVGLLYRYGYFTQKLSSNGEQEATYEAQNFSKLPISPVRDEAGNWLDVQVGLPGRMVTARLWKCDVGRTDLYLLDTDHDLNLEEDRQITYHLYGGNWENRLKQEMLLGLGGIRALRMLNIYQDVYHCNEGHAAFIGLERIYNLMQDKKLSFSEALEVVRSSSLFTTHTPVPAGHDAFPEDMLRQYMSHYPDMLGITWDQFMNLGKTNAYDHNEKFSMSFLACNLSQEVNGVSWLHGEVSKEILGSMWPGYFKDELHIGYVTNGVHYPTWTAGLMRKLYNKYFPEAYSEHQYDIPAWQKVHNIPDSELWSYRMRLKEKLIESVKRKLMNPTVINHHDSVEHLRRIGKLTPETLTIGFARRFATYKRAHLLFTNLDRLDRIVNNPDRPVQFIFAGKAHPADKAGQDLIKRIIEVANSPRFMGKIMFLQNYDIAIARRLVQGVDVWLNTPTRPLEASGTSGEKCVMNGVLQFSVLDGWWVEGYKKGAGWMLPMEKTFNDQKPQDEMDAEMIYSTIENEIAPKYYDRDADGVPRKWVESIKMCVADIASHFTTNRMLTDYQERFYNKLYERRKKLTSQNYLMARDIAAWKRRVSAAWDNVNILSVDKPELSKGAILLGDDYHITVRINLAGLKPEDIGVEIIAAQQIDQATNNVKILYKKNFEFESVEKGIATYTINTEASQAGSFDIAIRVYASNDKLPHRMDFALVKWV